MPVVACPNDEAEVANIRSKCFPLIYSTAWLNRSVLNMPLSYLMRLLPIPNLIEDFLNAGMSNEVFTL